MALGMKVKYLKSAEVTSVIVLILTGLSMHLWGTVNILDAKFFYTATEADTFFRSLDPSQWQAYLINEALDLVFLTSYSLLFFFLARKVYFVKSRLAFIPGVFDLFETATIVMILLNKAWSPPVWLGYVTCFKWVTGVNVVIWLFVGYAFRKKQE
jgi:hypothetical protein